MAERQFGPYRLIRQIAVGGMAEIHLAKTAGIAGFEKYVAIKMIHPNFAEDEQFIQMLVDEAKIAVQLTHGNIAQTFDLGRVGDTYYITMEYVDGADLYKLLRRGSEQDIEMPLDVCAFIGKEITSALDHAHRKRDHLGKSLGIVHRDVSPQNVLVSYAGEIKLVDFGIAKATMKARQTAVGVIKGKYYYMSPEQAWGDPIDFRSDIFSAGIVLYEMITGQMLYLEEDLHKLLEMARAADIAPPSKLRRGIPPQLERIVMHALQKVPGERYQSAGDFATDLERFLHAYSPVFTASKIVGLLRQVVGDPMGVPDEAPEMRDGPRSTHQLAAEELAQRGEELRDENSVIFRVVPEGAGNAQKVAQVKPAAPSGPKPKPAPLPIKPAPDLPARAARPPTDSKGSPVVPRVVKKTPPVASPVIPEPAPIPNPPRAIRPRNPEEHTRELGSAPPGPLDEMSGLLTLEEKAVTPNHAVARWDASETHPGDEDLENIGERTVITTAPNAGDYLGDSDYGVGDDSHEGGEATLITQMPQRPDTDEVTAEHRADEDSTEELPPDDQDEDGPTMSRDFTEERKTRNRSAARPREPAPAAFAAKIHAPAVSEIRKPKPSRRTPPGGFPAQSTGNVLQAIVSSQVQEPMPSPAPPRPQPQPPPQLFAPPPPLLQQPQYTPPGFPPVHQPHYQLDAAGLPIGLPTPPPGMPVQNIPGVPSHLQPYGQPQYPPQQHMTPGALYQHQPYGAPPPQPMSITGQMRLFETDEIPSQYKIGGKRKRLVTVLVAGIIAVGVAAGVAFFVIHTAHNTEPRVGSVHVESSPPGADVLFDGVRQTAKTPLTLDSVQIGTRHEIRIELSKYAPHIEAVEIPAGGGEVPVTAMLKPITGKLVINTQPKGAEIKINDKIRGLTPATIPDVDMDSAKKLELRLKDYTPVVQDLEWPANGEIDLDIKLTK